MTATAVDLDICLWPPLDPALLYSNHSYVNPSICVVYLFVNSLFAFLTKGVFWNFARPNQ
jgi:hypothetical protein